MLWLPPNYRIIYADELQYINDLEKFLETGSLFCTLNKEIIAVVEYLEIVEDKLRLYLKENKKDIFSQLNLHYQSFRGKIIVDEFEIVSNLIELEKICTKKQN